MTSRPNWLRRAIAYLATGALPPLPFLGFGPRPLPIRIRRRR